MDRGQTTTNAATHRCYGSLGDCHKANFGLPKVRDVLETKAKLEWRMSLVEPENSGSLQRRQPTPDQCVVLPGGRRIAFAEFGAPAGASVLYFHGFPASRLEAQLVHRAAVNQRVRLLALDRPGFGRSDFQPRTLAQWPEDVLEVADALRLERFAILGVSGGAPFTLACAVALASRVSAIAIIAGLGMTSVSEDLARFDAIARVSFRLARSAPALSRTVNRALAAVLRRRPELLNTLLAAGMSPPDREVLADPHVAATLAASLREALRSGSEGASHELSLLARPWGFDVAAVRVPCHLWHGERDCTVPIEMARRLAALIPGCGATFLADEGHFSLPVRHAETVLRTLLQDA
jgi:pimeloyl-ACP methyl ester carboxylesterase